MKSERFQTKGFKFKQFSIHGGESGMPVSTDGVMLGAWANCSPQSKILDIGTGTGLLALMCAQRFPNAQITALDIEIFEKKNRTIHLSIYLIVYLFFFIH